MKPDTDFKSQETIQNDLQLVRTKVLVQSLSFLIYKNIKPKKK